MFFPEDQNDSIIIPNNKIIYIYENGITNQKPIEIQHKKNNYLFKNIQNIFKFNILRLFNSQGAQYFQDDLQYLKNKAVLYASKGQDFDPGSCFGEYEMIQKLGQGGFGRVFLAKHKQTGQKYAIKTIKTENIASVNDIDAIFVQAEILKSLKHENIIKVYNCLTLRNMQVAIIMQYLQGGQLLQYMQKSKKLDEETTKIFFKQIVKGMLYCHQNNLIHRDLKLENLLLVNKQQKKIKIIDFGIAGAINAITWSDLDTGSLAYMAPQCFINNKNYKVDGRIDVWAAGVILICMLTGQLPFKGDNYYQTIQLIKLGSYHINNNIIKILSKQCLDVIKKCLNPDPLNRITMQELSDHPWILSSMFTIKQQQKPKLELIYQEKKQFKINNNNINNNKLIKKNHNIYNKSSFIVNKNLKGKNNSNNNNSINSNNSYSNNNHNNKIDLKNNSNISKNGKFKQ